MAKEKKAKGSMPNKNVHLRLSFLHQAASYLAHNAGGPAELRGNEETDANSRSVKRPRPHTAQTRHLLSHMKGVSRKSVIRLQKDVKRTVCKGCDQLLDDQSSTRTVENKSKGGAKPWASVLVVKCNTCGTAKRFPT
ncbi:hypothetical protein PMZ80_006031 [Knufia obscura]|uniref:Uncharacterized protein n=2 Tax=Knufia TaxID=430999 RepID=A0AAN8EID6_9EURO|nr:hypothetical protein PMZ80_006031 [Knufia obscura]KAK5954700.1 hypothetical protein OHC33_004424 [Knufia fluminis]